LLVIKQLNGYAAIGKKAEISGECGGLGDYYTWNLEQQNRTRTHSAWRKRCVQRCSGVACLSPSVTKASDFAMGDRIAPLHPLVVAST